jgi:hypothetical protein
VALTGSMSPSLLGVNSTARMSEVAVSMAKCTLRPLSRFAGKPLPVAWQGMPACPRRGQRLASTLNAMLSGLPFITRQWFARKPREGAITEELDASAVHKQVEGATGAPIRDLDG